VLLLFNIAGSKHHYAIKSGDQGEAHTGGSGWPIALSRIDSQDEGNTGNGDTLD
jgi:hypothetical protein